MLPCQFTDPDPGAYSEIRWGWGRGGGRGGGEWGGQRVQELQVTVLPISLLGRIQLLIKVKVMIIGLHLGVGSVTVDVLQADPSNSSMLSSIPTSILYPKDVICISINTLKRIFKNYLFINMNPFLRVSKGSYLNRNQNTLDWRDPLDFECGI